VPPPQALLTTRDNRTHTIAGSLALNFPHGWHSGSTVGTILQVRVLKHGSPLPLVAVGTWSGTIVLLPFALSEIGQPMTWTLPVALSFAYLVLLGSCVGLVLQLWLTRRLRPTTMTLTQLLISAQALVIGAIALGESITWRMLGGAALVALAIAFNAVAGARTRSGAEPVIVAAGD